MDAIAIAKQAGTAQAMNVVMLGALSRYIPLSEDLLLAALAEVVPPENIWKSQQEGLRLRKG